MYSLTKKEFRKLAEKGNLIPVYREIFSDLETPVSAYIKLGGAEYSYLLESVEGGDKWGRYTFLGSDPANVFIYKNDTVTFTRYDETKTYKAEGDPLHELKKIMSMFKTVAVRGLPRFSGGAVGFLSYDSVRHFEKMPETVKDELGTPDAVFVLTDTILIFDNVSHTIKVVSNAFIGDEGVDAAYEKAVGKIDKIINKLKGPVPYFETVKGDPSSIDFKGNIDKETFERNVEKCKEYIREGDIFQVVLAQRMKATLHVPAFQVYRALRTINPSPYMYFLNLGGISVVGASPESLVRVEGETVEVRPIAGTRPRGADDVEDIKLSEELLADAKERAEHIMLVDLGRNDVGRVAIGGSVDVNELMLIEKYSHVIHIVSNVRGKIKPGVDAYDALRATFPAGTLSGAPKIRAMEIIEEMEGTRRGVYGGAVGYFSFSGNMDVAIAIRTLQIEGNTAYLGVGAGIVADSVPATEYQETINKGKALMKAVELAENGLEELK
ncbi:Anthranilate synthase, aminase component [hydrothermal vent metagenome]|uniref:Anthranilate synthase component 1 n=1 Tax=hydrothermal vent metagenome TaxID=652676 RepID=A0A3B1BQM0_9ZZZZ